MNNILSEKDYQKYLLERLADNGYVIRKASHFDRLFAVDREMLMKFLADTQPDTMDYLRKIYKDDLEDTIVSFINAETTKARGSLIDVLKHGIEISNRQLDLMYTKPATTFNPELTKKYGQNIFSVMEEVWASDKERIDVVIFPARSCHHLLRAEVQYRRAVLSGRHLSVSHRAQPQDPTVPVQGRLPCKLCDGLGGGLHDHQAGGRGHILSAVQHGQR